MPLDPIVFPNLSQEIPCATCKSSVPFLYVMGIHNVRDWQLSSFLNFTSPNEKKQEGLAKIHCKFLRRSVDHIEFLFECPFFEDS
jgi:hypothetical protein